MFNMLTRACTRISLALHPCVVTVLTRTCTSVFSLRVHGQVRAKFTDACSGSEITTTAIRVAQTPAKDSTLELVHRFEDTVAQTHRLEAADALTKASLATCSQREAQQLVRRVVEATGRSSAKGQLSVAALLDDLRGQATEAVSREVHT